ncbi:MAG TPA: PEPxxWA-CTERM sorting domain-containing protein [Sphingomonas sp.]
MDGQLHAEQQHRGCPSLLIHDRRPHAGAESRDLNDIVIWAGGCPRERALGHLRHGSKKGKCSMNRLEKTALMIAAWTLASAAEAATLVVPVVDAMSLGHEGTAGNTILTYDIGAYAHVVGIDFDVTLTVFDLGDDSGWLSDQSVYFGSRANFTPGYEMTGPGTVSFAGMYDLRGVGLDFFVDDNGLLNLEFVDSFNKSRTPKASWNGTFTVTYDPPAAVPEPASWALMIVGFGVVAGTMRYQRRRRRLAFA